MKLERGPQKSGRVERAGLQDLMVISYLLVPRSHNRNFFEVFKRLPKNDNVICGPSKSR